MNDKINRERLYYFDFKDVIIAMKRILDVTPYNIPKYIFDLKEEITLVTRDLVMSKNAISPIDEQVVRDLLDKLKQRLSEYEKKPATGGRAFQKLNGITA